MAGVCFKIEDKMHHLFLSAYYKFFIAYIRSQVCFTQALSCGHANNSAEKEGHFYDY